MLVDPPKTAYDAELLFHRLWTKAVGTKDYDKREWQQLEMYLRKLGHNPQPIQRQMQEINTKYNLILNAICAFCCKHDQFADESPLDQVVCEFLAEINEIIDLPNEMEKRSLIKRD